MSDEEKDFMSNLLMIVEIIWVAGVAVIFILYFALKRHFRKKREAEAQAQAQLEGRDN